MKHLLRDSNFVTSKVEGEDLGDAFFLHGHPNKHVCNGHGALIVRNDNELTAINKML